MAEHSPGVDTQGKWAPADSLKTAHTDDVVVYEFPFRMTKMGGTTLAYVYCYNCRRVLEPTGKKRSRTGNHGYDYYLHNVHHVIEYAVITSSNSGNRYASFSSGFPPELAKEIKLAWVFLAMKPTVQELNKFLTTVKDDQP